MIVSVSSAVQPGSAPIRVEGFAIVSQDNMIAAADGSHPNELWLDADQCFYRRSLQRADVIVHGRNSVEFIPGRHSRDYWDVVALRRRIILTRAVGKMEPDPVNPRATLWNPEGVSFAAVCSMLGIRQGTVAINGGTQVYELFLEIGYDIFYLSVVKRVTLVGGRPLFSAVADLTLKEIFDRHGLELASEIVLSASADLRLLVWMRKR